MILKTMMTVMTLLMTLTAGAQEYDKYFENATLRLDYIFAGDQQKQDIYLERLMRQERWAGRKSRLSEKFLEGNGQLTVCDHATHDVLYVWTFSTLFQEWLEENEAKTLRRAFECCYNVPFPKEKVDITITLTDKHHKVMTEMTHTVDPKDILIRRIGDNGIPYKYVWIGSPKSPLPASPRGGEDLNSLANGKPNEQNISKNLSPSGESERGLESERGFAPDITNCVDLAIVAEGYTAQEMDKFYKDCERSVEALFEREPFKSLKSRFNVVAVAAPSLQSGPSVPHKGVWNNTAMSTHYDTFYSERYLTSQNMHEIYDKLSGVPFEHIMVLVNTPIYGGGGIYNQVTFASSDHPTFKRVFVHEFGHSYGGLADEYAYDDMDTIWYPADTEPWEPNITTLHDFSKKWADLVPKDTPIPTPLDKKVPDFRSIDQNDAKQVAKLNACVQKVGVFEGAGYQTKGCYRPAQECRMKINEVLDFCPVCTRAIQQITEYYTAP